MDGKGVKGRPDGIHMAYDVFWDECQSIHSEHGHENLHEAEGKAKENEIDQVSDDLEWLNDIGFACVIMKYKNDDEIDPDDTDLQSMTSTLTRRQSETVRKRIRSLNETLKRKRKESSHVSRHPDVRDIFPVQSQRETATDDRELKKQSIRQIEKIASNDRSGAHRDNGMATGESHSPSRSKVEYKDDSYINSPITSETKMSHLRQLADLNISIFYTPDSDKSSGSQLAGNVRPPGPRRAKSEGLFQSLKAQESEKNAQGKLTLDKTRSEGSPLMSLAGKCSNSKCVTQSKPTCSKSRREHFADSEEISRIYGVSPKRLEVMKHKSAEDLMKISLSNNNNNMIKPSTPDNTVGLVKNDGIPIEGDAKLNIGTDFRGKQSSPSTLSGGAFSPLPNFTLQPEQLGITRIVDLSEPDMVKVRSLALIELTALFDTFGISMSRRRQFAKLKQKENGVFGVPLSILSQKNKNMKAGESQAPRFFQDLIAFLKTNGLREEGLLRIPGSQQRIKVLREEIDDAYSNDGFFSWQDRRINDVATVLKQFLRELPSPLLTHNYQEAFISVSELKERELQLQALNLLVLLLPPVNRDTLRILLEFLLKVIAVENINKMGLNNVAMIMAPNLFLRENSPASLNEIKKATATTDIMRMLIKYQSIIWTVPGFMVKQIRYIYEAGSKGRDSKAVKKIIAKRIKSEANPSNTQQQKSKFYGSGDELDCGEADYERIIRVKAPMCNKTCMAVQLTEYMTAADIVARFRSKRKNSVKDYNEPERLKVTSSATRCRSDSNLDKDEDDTFSLYEHGGNIGERCLDPNTSISALLKANPSAELIVRCNDIS